MKFITLLLGLIMSISFAAEEKNVGQFLGSKHIEQMPGWFKTSFLDLEEDVTEAAENNKHLIVYFHQDGCPYCAKLVEENFRNKQLVAKIQKNFEVIEINMWGDKSITNFDGSELSEKEYAELLKVQFTPSLFFMDNIGKILLRMDGYQSIEKMHILLDFISSKSYKTTSFIDFANYNNIGSLNAQDFFDKPPYNLSRNENYPAKEFLAVFFERPNCKECDNFHNELLQKNNIKNVFYQMEVVQLNAISNQKIITPKGEKTTATKWYHDLKLTSMPAVVLFDKNGTEIIRKDGFLKEFHFDSILQYTLTESYKKYSSFQRYIEHRADKIRATGKDVDLWK